MAGASQQRVTRTAAAGGNGRTTPRRPAPQGPNPLLAAPSSGSAILRAPLAAPAELQVGEDEEDVANLMDVTQEVGDSAPTAAAENILGAVTDDALKTDVTTGDEIDNLLGAGDSTELGAAGVGLFTAITGFIGGLRGLYSAVASEKSDEAISAAFESVMKAGDIVKSSIGIAEKGAGAAIGASVMPGLDLAFSVLSLAGNIGSLYKLHKVSGAEAAVLEKAEAKGDQNLVTALGTAQARRHRKLGLTYVQLAGDITMIVGGIAQLATGPWGAAVKMAGALAKVAGAAAGVIAEHFEAQATRAAREDYDAKMATGTDEEKKAATTNRLSKDALFAVQEMLDKGLPKRGPDGKVPPIADEMRLLFAGYGLGPSFLAKWASVGGEGGKKVLLTEAENTILKFLGTSRDPKTLSETILGGLKAVWDWFKRLAGGSTEAASPVGPGAAGITLDAGKTAMPVVKEYALKKLNQGKNGIKPDVLTKALESVYKQLVVKHTANVTDPTDKETNLKAIDDGIKNAIGAVNRAGFLDQNFPMTSVTVVNGVVSFTFPYPPSPAAQGGQAGAQPQPQGQPQQAGQAQPQPSQQRSNPLAVTGRS
jgi:hypothetical protein